MFILKVPRLTPTVNGIINCISRFKRVKRHCLCTKFPNTTRHYSTAKPKDNIILIGSPGSGKTTVGRLVAKKLHLPVLDIDDDHLEPYWNMPVADKLAEVGPERFIEEEGKALLDFNSKSSVVSLTGSNPMHDESMSQIAKSGVVVFLDVNNEDIVKRLQKMKVNRIVGQESGASMAEILKYRQQFYEMSYDIRILVGENETQESIANKIVEALKTINNNKGYISTRQNLDQLSDFMSFSDVVLKGLASDGGLYVPNIEMPRFSPSELRRLLPLNYQDRALRILEKWIHPIDLHPSTLKDFITKAYSEDTFHCNDVFPVRHLEGNQYLCELFHGPTASFKDAALQLLPHFFKEAVCLADKNSDVANSFHLSNKSAYMVEALAQYMGIHHMQMKLAEVGPERFIEEEGKALLDFNSKSSVVSLTGSNPMHDESMSQIAKSGVVVFLDVNNEDIVKRLQKMKVNRIVGQESGASMAEILKYRQQFYEMSYDIRILVGENETQESIANKIVEALKTINNNKGYISTRQNLDQLSDFMSFSDVVLKGLASDGGLYVPNIEMPRFSPSELRRLLPLNYQDRALRILEKWIHPIDLHPSTLKDFITKAYSEDTFHCNDVFPVRHLEGNQYLCELFHGPTASFKDAALQLLPHFFKEAVCLADKNSDVANRYLILVATSGDTGGAVLDGFTRHADTGRIGVMVLYPEEGISEIQKKQMTSIAGTNVHVVGVKGDFDLCQSIVKRAFTDESLIGNLKSENCLLSAANSISWGRLVPQIVFHVSSYLELVKMNVVEFGDQVDVCIPTGNFGNILAAFYAKQMGVPFKQLIIASNSNNVLTECLHTGTYDLRKRKLIKSLSPAMDILVSSNLERYIYHVSAPDTVRQCFDSLTTNRYFELPKQILKTMQKDFTADWCSENECGTEIRETLNRTGYLLDPHTAVGKVVANRLASKDRPVIIASTAHYEKFAPEVLGILGESNPNAPVSEMFEHLSNLCKYPSTHKNLMQVLSRPRVHNVVLNGSYNHVVEEIQKFRKQL